ncbi:MAG: hypothetical protein AAGJ84_02330 [Pseudomonadota bacterium]
MLQLLSGRAFAVACASLLLCGCVTDISETPSNVAEEKPAAEARQLVGVWDVSLFFSSSAPPASTVMDIRSVNEDGTLEGTFYNTPFETARYTERKGVVAFSIITRDGSGQYATSGRLSGDGLVNGQTLSTGRAFIITWEAERRN